MIWFYLLIIELDFYILYLLWVVHLCVSKIYNILNIKDYTIEFKLQYCFSTWTFISFTSSFSFGIYRNSLLRYVCCVHGSSISCFLSLTSLSPFLSCLCLPSFVTASQGFIRHTKQTSLQVAKNENLMLAQCPVIRRAFCLLFLISQYVLTSGHATV